MSRFSLVQAISGFEMYHVGDNMVAEVDVVLPMSFKLKEAHDLGEVRVKDDSLITCLQPLVNMY